jgi:uncharacterized repeat protein (TIGR01451 family)
VGSDFCCASCTNSQIALAMARFITHLARTLTALIAVLMLASWVHAGPALVGTQITNIATGSYIDAATGLNIRLNSNTVVTVVQPMEALQLSSNQSIGRAPGTDFSLAHQLTNTGNVVSTLTLKLVNAGGSFSATGLNLVQDVNSNGVADLGEPIFASGQTVTLQPGALMNLLVIGAVPPTANPGQSATIVLTATSQVQAASASNNDTVNVVNGPAISVTKSASTASPTQGGVVTYTLNAQNSGLMLADPVNVSINGAPSSFVVLRDAIPANTTFASLSSPTANVLLLHHKLGDPINSYVTTPPPAGNVDAVAWGLPKLLANTNLVGSFNVTVNSNAADQLINTGYVDYNTDAVNYTTASNPVRLNLPPLAPTLTFYRNDQYVNPVRQSALGGPLFVQVNAAQCNTDATTVQTQPISITSLLSGDREIFTSTETGPNTGLFRILPNVPTADASVSVVVAGDGILQVLRNDKLTAILTGCGSGSEVTATLLIDPSGIVFDSKSNAPVAGAQVRLIDVTGAGNGGFPGGAATVFTADGVTPAPSVLTTGVDGRYDFPYVPASTYRFVVTPPNGYAFPSKLPSGLLPVGRNIDDTGSYGGNFTVSALGGAVTIDMPLDTGAAGGLFLQKIASKSTAEVGDFVDYTLNIYNNTGSNLLQAVLQDKLPASFAYVKGTARLSGVPLTDPVGGSGPTLVFGLGHVETGVQRVLSYRVRIGPGGAQGSGINTAQVISGPTSSNVATAKVLVTGGVLSERAYLFGKVYADCNNDRVQKNDELGIPGVHIYLDNGTYAVTDSEGKYSLYGLTPRTYVAKVDQTTLPTGVALKVLNNRNALDPASQFIDLQKGELHKADFAVTECTPKLREQITALSKALKNQLSEIALAATTALKANPVTINDARTLPSTGVMGQPTGAQAATGIGISPLTAASPAWPNTAGLPNNTLPNMPASSETQTHESQKLSTTTTQTKLETLLLKLTPQTGFIDLVEGQIMSSDQTRVRVKGPLGTDLRLTVNGQILSLKQVGQQSSLESRGVTAWDYIGVNLKPGSNTISLNATDSFGNNRGQASVRVIAPDKLAQIKLTTAPEMVADGRTPSEINVQLLDKHGVPVTSRLQLTLETNQGEWQTPDLNPAEPGTQVFVEGGVGQFKLLPPTNPGKTVVSVSSGTVKAETTITFMPYLRPLLAVGVVEGVFSLRSLNASNLEPARSGDAFEREIQNLSQSMNNGKASVAARTSLFLKGKVLGSNLLTLAYDSDKPNDTALFRDIQPDQFYPVYGDSSVKGYDAQSTGKLYVRIDRGTSFVLYGDYTTLSDNPARLLSQYSRTLNGVKSRIESNGYTVDSFLSYTNSTQIIDEIPANGTSGPYPLSQRGEVNSQQVTIVTRDRNQPSLVLSSTPLVTLIDYTLEPFTGQILLKAPVPSVNIDLNPIYIRVAYEVSTGGPEFWVGGVDVRKKIANNFTLGGTYVRDTNPVNRISLFGANLTWNLGANTTLTAEAAQSDSDALGIGNARRIELRSTDPSAQVAIYAVQTDSEFNNPNSTYTAGASEYGAKIGYTINDKNRLVIDALKSTTSGAVVQSPSSIALPSVPTSMAGGGSRAGASIGIEHSLPMNVKLTASVRHVDAQTQPTQPLGGSDLPNEYTSARVRLDTPVPHLPKANAFVQYEAAVDASDRKAATAGAAYQLSTDTKLYATHQTSNSLSGDYGLTATQQNYSTVVGLTSAYMKDGQLFNEYRVGDSIDGRSAQAAFGLRNLWELAPGLRLSTGIQQIHPISGVVTDRATALTGALEYTAQPGWKGSTRLEWSRSATTTTWLGNLGVAVKLDSEFTLLGRGLYNEQKNNEQRSSDQQNVGSGLIRLGHAQLGLAYRPVNSNVWNALARVESKHRQNSTLGIGLNTDEVAHIFSTHVNYQPTADWLLTTRYGVKWVAAYANNISTSTTTQVLGVRSAWDITRRWDAGLQYYLEWGSNGLSNRQQAVGAELGYLVMKNLWLSGGYNITGFKDADLTGSDYTQRGGYLRLRFKFDETLFKQRHHVDRNADETLINTMKAQ